MKECKTLTAYSMRRFSHEQLCRIAIAPVKTKQKINTKLQMKMSKTCGKECEQLKVYTEKNGH